MADCLPPYMDAPSLPSVSFGFVSQDIACSHTSGLRMRREFTGPDRIRSLTRDHFCELLKSRGGMRLSQTWSYGKYCFAEEFPDFRRIKHITGARGRRTCNQVFDEVMAPDSRLAIFDFGNRHRLPSQYPVNNAAGNDGWRTYFGVKSP
jgi:hypothetical protein